MSLLSGYFRVMMERDREQKWGSQTLLATVPLFHDPAAGDQPSLHSGRHCCVLCFSVSVEAPPPELAPGNKTSAFRGLETCSQLWGLGEQEVQ